MKKISLILVLLAFSFAAMSNPPKKVTLKFDLKSQEIDVNIQHSVGDITDHFIENVVVKLNDQEVVNENYDKQKDTKGDLFRYKLENVKKGDVLEVTATCNKWGKKTSKITIE
ncbi:MAG: hypothetical protein JW729_10650 [Bacteroidales bacterium]|nr:hypothetical protein [Bacteroidales bacterium]